MILPGLVAFSISVHLVPYLAGLGHPGAVAAAALGATIGISAIGKIGGGFAGDRFGPLQTLRYALLLDVVALVLLQYAAGAAALSAFVICYGLALGAQIAVVPAIAVTVLNAERFGTLFGFLQLAAMLASAIGPISSGVIYDKTGQYSEPSSCGSWRWPRQQRSPGGCALPYRSRGRVAVELSTMSPLKRPCSATL